MGEVFRARDVRLGREVAVKFLSDRLQDRELGLERFEREARAASSLNHPNIVTVHDVGAIDDRPYIVMELVEGRTLRQMMARARPPTLHRTLEIAAQVAEAMAVAHAAGIVHRDLKPENLIVTDDGRVKVLDFGLAKFGGRSLSGELAPRADALTLGADDSGEVPLKPRTGPGALLGTVGFMAPEQVRGGPVDFRADQFSFGAILYELVTGRPAFSRSSRMSALKAILDEEPESLATAAPQLPPQLRWIIARCLAKRPTDRYASSLDLAREVRTLADHLDETSSSGGSRTSPRWASAALPGSGRRRAVVLAVAAVVVLAAAGAVWRTLSRTSPLPQVKQLAVLAFRAAGGDAAEQLLCDGIMETLTTRLTQLERFEGSFWVVPASEIRRAGVDTATAASRTFGATLVVSGSVQRLGDRLRLNASLVDASNLRQLRALSFDALPGDVAALQDDLVRRVGEMLDLEVGPEARRVLDAGGTRIADAYNAYLRGRGHLLKFQDPKSVEAAVSDFQEALQRDPEFALAYAGLGETYWRQYELGHDPAIVDLARRSCERALELNGLLAPVHITLGLLHGGTGEPERAVADFETALRLDPASAVARRELGLVLTRLGRRKEAEETLRAAIERRAGDWANHNALGRFYYTTGRYPEAAEQFRKVVEIAPDNVRGWSNLGGIYQLEGRYEPAREALARAVSIQPTSGALSNLGTLQFFLHDYGAAAGSFERALELDGERDYRLWQNLGACYYWAPGQRERAAPAFRRAIELAEQALGVNPRDARLLADLAECEAMLDRSGPARARIEAALAIAPADPDILFLAASVYEHLGERKLALEKVRAALGAGYSRQEIEAIPDFADLRQDARYKKLSEDAQKVGKQ